MRIVFIGAGDLAVATTRLLLDRGHEVIIIEPDREGIDTLSDELACSFLHGDGSHPSVLREAAAGQDDVLFCLSESDQANIIGSLIGQSLGFGRVVTMVSEPDYRPICLELGLKDTIVPSETISRYLADLVGGRDVLELSTMVKGEARFFSFTVSEDAGKTVEELELPEQARAVCYYRDDTFYLADDDTRLQADDEVVILTHSKHLEDLRDRWQPQSAEEGPTAEVGEDQPSQ